MDLGLDPGSENNSCVTFEKSLGLSGLYLLGRNLPPPSPHIISLCGHVLFSSSKDPSHTDLGSSLIIWGFPGGSMVKNPPAVQEIQETLV